MKKSLREYNPNLAKQWHPTKNGEKNPDNISYGSKYEAWWLLPYDDLKTGKHFDFEWKARVCNRTINKRECPYLSGQKVWPEFNDLESNYPDLAREWHPIKNGNLKPSDVTTHYTKKVWWYLPYDDPKTGKHFDFEWEVSVDSRVNNDSKCPYLSGQAVWPGFNDLALNRSDLAAEWHPTKNGKLTPKDVTVSSGKRVWWYLPYDDPKTGKHFDFEWKAKIYHRVKGEGCPFLAGKKVWVGFNDLKSVNEDLAKQIHPTKNNGLKAEDIIANSNKKMWWIYPYDDPRTGKHFDFEWQASSASRLRNNGCPFLSNQRVWPGFNDLKTRYPQIAEEWCYDLNGDKVPEMYMPNSKEEVWWECYIQDENGADKKIVWPAKITNRVQGDKCPYLSNQRVLPGYNDIGSLREDLVEEWDDEKNFGISIDTVAPFSSKKRWWKCRLCGELFYVSPAKRMNGQDHNCMKEA
ncbi:MAG: zinc-ribbon domain-containing protein [Parasporobacterium sp.]|nr:zinc-ribbon domain-containing protein [Parasporobacterium sp.]